MSNRFLIRQAELHALEGTVSQICNRLSSAADAALQSADLFINHDSNSGAFVTSAKACMAQVHKALLLGIEQAARELQMQFREYLRGYTQVDGQDGFVLPSEQMEEFTNALRHEVSDLAVCAGQIRRILQSVSSCAPAAAAQSFPWEQAEGETKGICARVQGLKETVISYEAASKSRLSHLRELTASLEQTVRLVSSGHGRGLGLGVYVPGTFISIAGLPAALLSEQVMVHELKTKGIGEERIRLLKSYGYQPADLVKLYDSCETEDDQAFFSRLFNGNYESAFSIDPAHLSDPMSLMLSDYAGRLFESGETNAFQEFVNGILLQNGGTGWFSDPAPGVKTIRMSYLEELFQGTMVLLEMNSALLLQGRGTAQMKERNWHLLSLANLWASGYHLENELQYQKDPLRAPVISFSDLGTRGGDMEYTYYYTRISHNPFQEHGEVVSIEVSSDLLETSEDLLGGTYLAEREQLQESADQLLQKIMGDSLWSAGCSVLSVALPEAGVAMKMLETAVKEDYDKADDHLLNLAGKVSPGDTGSTGLVLGEAIDGLQTYLDKNAELSDRISRLDELYEGSMWGTGVRSSYVAPGPFSSGEETHILSGIYNPEYLETLGKWNREGITALIPDADLAQIDHVCSTQPQYSFIGPDTLEYKMLYGFGEESILDYPVSDIAKAKQTVESIVREASQGNSRTACWNIEEAF